MKPHAASAPKTTAAAARPSHCQLPDGAARAATMIQRGTYETKKRRTRIKSSVTPRDLGISSTIRSALLFEHRTQRSCRTGYLWALTFWTRIQAVSQRLSLAATVQAGGV